MHLRGEKLARSLLVNDSFDQVAKIPFVQRKWIAAEAWFELIKKEVPNCAITDISLRWFKTYLLNSGRFIQDSNFHSPDGFYARQRKMKLDGMTTQKTITCFLVTEAGQPPPITSKDWTESIITAVIPSHVVTRSGIHSSYMQEISHNVNCNKRKRCHQASNPPLSSITQSATPQQSTQFATPQQSTQLATPQQSTQSATPTYPQQSTQFATCPKSVSSPLNIHSQTNLLSHLNPDPQSSPNTVFQPSHIFIQDYWHSTEAKNLFGIEKTN